MRSLNSSSPTALSTVKKRTWERRLDDAKMKHRPRLRDWKKDEFSTRRRNDFKIPADNFSNQIRNLSICPESACSAGDDDDRNTHEKKKQRREKRNLRDDKFESGKDNESHNFGAVANVVLESNNERFTVNENRSSNRELREIDRISCKNLTPAQFIKNYEKRRVPCIISDIPRNEKWTAEHSWNFRSLNSSNDNVGNSSTDNDKSYLSDNSSLGKDCDTMASLRNNFFKVGEDDSGIKVKVKLKYFLRYLAMNGDDSPLYIFDR